MERRTIFGSALALFKTGGSAHNVNSHGAVAEEVPKEPEIRDAFQMEIEEHHYKFTMNANPTAKMKASTEMAMIAWNGGEHAQNFIDKIHALDDFIDILKSASEPESLRMHMLKVISVVERNNRRIQDSLREYNFHKVLYDLLEPSESDNMRKWAAHTLFYFLVGNPANQALALKMTNIESRILMASALDWSRFDDNDAQELLLMLYPQ